MTTRLDQLFSLHQASLAVRGQRAQVLASNIANADTPGYRARDVDFRAAMSAALAGRQPTGGTLARTAAGHVAGIAGETPFGGFLQFRTVSQASIDNNTVDVNVERAQFADNAMRTEASLVFLNGRIRGLMSAIQG